MADVGEVKLRVVADLSQFKKDLQDLQRSMPTVTASGGGRGGGSTASLAREVEEQTRIVRAQKRALKEELSSIPKIGDAYKKGEGGAGKGKKEKEGILEMIAGTFRLRGPLGMGIGVAGQALGLGAPIIGALILLKDVVSTGFQAVFKVVGVITKLLGMIVMPFANLLIPVLMPIIWALSMILKFIMPVMRPFYQSLMAAMKAYKGGAMEGSAAGALIGLALGGPAGALIGMLIGPIIGAALEKAGILPVLNKIIDIGLLPIKIVLDAIKLLFDAVSTVITFIQGVVGGFKIPSFDPITLALDSIKAVLNLFTPIMNVLKEIGYNIFKAVVDLAVGVFDALTKIPLIGGMFTGLKNDLKAMSDAVETAYKGTSSKGRELTTAELNDQAVQGLIAANKAAAEGYQKYLERTTGTAGGNTLEGIFRQMSIGVGHETTPFGSINVSATKSVSSLLEACAPAAETVQTLADVFKEKGIPATETFAGQIYKTSDLLEYVHTYFKNIGESAGDLDTNFIQLNNNLGNFAAAFGMAKDFHPTGTDVWGALGGTSVAGVTGSMANAGSTMSPYAVWAKSLGQEVGGWQTDTSTGASFKTTDTGRMYADFVQRAGQPPYQISPDDNLYATKSSGGAGGGINVNINVQGILNNDLKNQIVTLVERKLAEKMRGVTGA